MAAAPSFWATILLGARSYGGGAFRPHVELNMKVPLTRGHFDRWLFLWTQSVDELFEGPKAELAKAHAIRVAAAFESRLRSFDEQKLERVELPLVHQYGARARS